MIDREDTAALVRMTGVAFSISSAVVMFIKPFDYVTNTLVVYALLITAALLVIIGQLIIIVQNQTGEFKNHHKRIDAIYDTVTIAVVMILFVIFYVIPFMTKHTTWLS
jgi:hypothetical protein